MTGLLDINTHVTRIQDGPAICLRDGVTGVIDAGIKGADGIAETVAAARSAPQPCRVLIDIGRGGVLEEGNTMDIRRANLSAAQEATRRNRDMIVGVKARLSRNVAGLNDIEVLRRSQGVASGFQPSSDDPYGADRIFIGEASADAPARRDCH